MFFGWFAKRYTLLVEIGNCMTYASIIQEKGRKFTLIEQVGVVTTSCKDGIIRNHSKFIGSLRELIKKLTINSWSKVIVGFDSTHIRSHWFNNINQKSIASILEHINSSNEKVIFHTYHNGSLTALTMRRNMLTYLYNCFEEAGIEVHRFVPIKYYYAYYADQIHNEYKDILMVINLGYRSTNITVFNKGFPVSYKTTYLGVENVVLAIADKYKISMEDAKYTIKNTAIFSADSRQWINCGGVQINEKEIADNLFSCYQALIQKVLTKDITKISHAVLIGWATKLPEMENIFENFIPNPIHTKEPDPRIMQPELVSLISLP